MDSETPWLEGALMIVGIVVLLYFTFVV